MNESQTSPRLRLGLPCAFHVTPAFLTEGCPSGASGSLGRAVGPQYENKAGNLTAAGLFSERKTRLELATPTLARSCSTN